MEEVIKRTWPLVDPWATRGNSLKTPHPSPLLGIWIWSTIPTPGAILKVEALREPCGIEIRWTLLRPLYKRKGCDEAQRFTCPEVAWGECCLCKFLCTGRPATYLSGTLCLLLQSLCLPGTGASVQTSNHGGEKSGTSKKCWRKRTVGLEFYSWQKCSFQRRPNEVFLSEGKLW